jgi:hypothetical protein
MSSSPSRHSVSTSPTATARFPDPDTGCADQPWAGGAAGEIGHCWEGGPVGLRALAAVPGQVCVAAPS